MKIDNYSFGRIIIDGKLYGHDVIILPDRVIENWWRKEGHSLSPGDLDAVIEAKPEVFIMGRGQMGVLRVPAETEKFLASHGTKLIAEATPKACQIYNELSRSKRVVCGLHLTC